MKKIIVFIFLFFLYVANFVFSQTKSVSVKKKQEEKNVLRPPAYDSSKTLELQGKFENYYQYIGLQLYLPPVINAESGPVLFSKKGNGVEKGNRYYTLVDVLKGDAVAQMKQKNLIAQCGYRYKELNSPQWNDVILHAVFVLRDNNKNDTLNNSPLYWIVCQSKQAPFSNSYFNSFVSSLYFEKQKQLYQNQNVINLSDKSKWLCKEVTLLKSKNMDGQDSVYDVFCLLTNEKGEQLQQRPPSEKNGRSFITEKEYIRLDHANRNQKEQMQEMENAKKEKYRSECIGKFGQHKGELIAQSKVEIGMTTEMCKAAWGAPWDISSSKAKETWFYNWKYNLCFENGIVVKIEH